MNLRSKCEGYVMKWEMLSTILPNPKINICEINDYSMLCTYSNMLSCYAMQEINSSHNVNFTRIKSNPNMQNHIVKDMSM